MKKARLIERWLPITATALALIWLLSGLRAPKVDSAFDFNSFGKIPALNGGRIKPLDTIARTALLTFRGHQTVSWENRRLTAREWLADMLFAGSKANRYKVFEIDDPDVLGFMGIPVSKDRYYAFSDLHPFMETIEKQARQADAVKADRRTRFQGAVLSLYSKLVTYQKIQNTVQLVGAEKVAADYQHFVFKIAPQLLTHMRDNRRTTPELHAMAKSIEKYRFMNDVAEFYPLPGGRGLATDDWVSVGRGLLDAASAPHLHPGVAAFAALGDTYRTGEPNVFRDVLAAYGGWLDKEVPKARRMARTEFLFNSFEPFYRSMILYVLVFLLAAGSWLAAGPALRRTAYTLLILTFAVHTVGLLTRMILQGRPPVTNLYSSAIFVGWAAVLLGIVLERLFKNGIGSAVASAVGFMTLIVAHHLTAQGDTLEMMRAVLDSNFWLATHVVAITIGYSSTFLAGFLAVLYILRRLFDKTWSAASARSIERMVYGIVCFSLFFSFTGTILGGIWADQSWGRFWGWDPKENGALMIVLWNALILHARVGGLAEQRSLMVMAVFGNIITAFSWFGVNMLGIGLHSYGFMDKAFGWLVIFSLSQLLIMGLGLLPDYMTRRLAPPPPNH